MASLKENEVGIKFKSKGADKVIKDSKDINKQLEKNSAEQQKNAKALDQNTNAQNRNNQAKVKGSKASGEYSNTLKGISSKLTLNNLMMMARAIRTVAEKTIELTKYSVDYIENLNLMDSAFGKNSEAARKWVDRISNIYGFDESTMVKQLGTFRQFGAALGFASDKADLLSKNLTLMAGDVSSLYNITFSQASEKLTSALTGQTKAIRSLGADITQASLQQELYRMGINESISDMNRAEKTLLIYISLERQLSNAQGDLAKTLMSPSNQMKVFTEQVKRLARAIGNSLLPVLAAILPIVNGVMMALTELFNLLATLLGYDPAQFEFGGALADLDALDDGALDLSDSFDNAAGSVGKTNKALDETKKKLDSLRGFDKLNVIKTPTDKSSSGSGSGGGSGIGGVAGGGINSKLLDALKEYNAHLDIASGKVKKIRDMILSWFGYTVDENGQLVKLKGKLTPIQRIFGLIGDIIKNIYSIIKDIVVQTIEWGKTKSAKDMYKAIADILETILGWIKSITDDIKDLYFTYLAPILPDILDILSLIVQIIRDILKFLNPIFKVVKSFIKLNLAAVLTAIGTAIKIIKNLLENIKTIIEAVGKAFKKVAEGDFVGALEIMKNAFKTVRENIKKGWEDITTYIKETFIKKMEETRKKGIEKLEEIVDWFKKLPERLGYLIGRITAKIIKFFTDPNYRKEIGEKIKEKILKGLIFFKKNVADVIQDLMEKLKDKIKNADWKEVGKAIGEAILKAITFPQRLSTKLINKLISGIKKGVNDELKDTKVTTKSNKSGNVSGSVKGISLQANGGFLNTGQLFVAREAGPELVGSIGNKTAVANNDQIVQAVSIGVQNAIARSGIGNARVIIEANGDSSGLMNFITFKQKQEERQYGL